MPLVVERELALERLKRICDQRFFSVRACPFGGGSERCRLLCEADDGSETSSSVYAAARAVWRRNPVRRVTGGS